MARARAEGSGVAEGLFSQLRVRPSGGAEELGHRLAARVFALEVALEHDRRARVWKLGDAPAARHPSGARARLQVTRLLSRGQLHRAAELVHHQRAVPVPTRPAMHTRHGAKWPDALASGRGLTASRGLPCAEARHVARSHTTAARGGASRPLPHVHAVHRGLAVVPAP
jgi:hypothetical protein